MLKRRSSWVKTAAVVIVLTMLWPYIVGNTAAQETRKKSYDLSARKEGDVLKLSPKVWTEINRFVFLIAFDIYAPGQTNLELVKHFDKLDSYPKLHQACRRWGNVTFPRLQQLAEELSTGEIRRLLTDLKSAVERRPNDPAGAEKAFVVAADKLVGKISQWEALSKDVKQDLDFLSTQTLAAATQLQGTQSPAAQRIVDVRSQLAGVVAALAGVNDHWGALSSDLSALRKEMQTNLNSSDPFMLDITLEIGLTSWESVEGAAKTFMTNVPAQRSYLNGDSYYVECPLIEGVWYLMQTLELLMRTRDQPGYQERTAVGVRGGEYKNLYEQNSGTGEPSARFQWRFERFGRGWWRIRNRHEGESKSVDIWGFRFQNPVTYKNPPDLSNEELKSADYFAPIINNDKWWAGPQRGDNLTIRTSQLWRCVPTPGVGHYFRIYNAYLGEMLSMETDSKMFTRMVESSNSPKQYWLFDASFPTKKQ